MTYGFEHREVLISWGESEMGLRNRKIVLFARLAFVFGAILIGPAVLVADAYCKCGRLETVASYIAGQRIFVWPTEIKLDQLDPNSLISFSFAIQNTESASVSPGEILLSCGCMNL
jgi:hypothetical protein